MEKTIELRLVEQASKVANMYQSKISKEQYEQLCNAIKVCRDYHVEEKGDWGDMYEVVLWEDGIWEYGEFYDFEQEITAMWGVVTRILMCSCYLGCKKEKDYEPQDLELRGENIPKFVDVLEQNIGKEIAFDVICDFFNKELCY